VSYYVKKNKNIFTVIEKETGLFLKSSAQEKEIRELCRKLNLGMGFNGLTPAFFAEYS
jgi:hypothetical protein